jgi:hypothetical protein
MVAALDTAASNISKKKVLKKTGKYFTPIE